MEHNQQDITSVKLINDIVIKIQRMEKSKQCLSDVNNVTPNIKQCLFFKDILKQCLLERDETMFIRRLENLNNVISKHCLN